MSTYTVHICTHTYKWVYIYTRVYIYLYISTRIHIYVCIYTHTHTYGGYICVYVNIYVKLCSEQSTVQTDD